MHSDCAFHIGKTHRICQDYAVAGEENETTFVLLADGCSSSPDTDIGARLLVQSAKQVLPGSAATPTDWAAYHKAAIRQAVACAEGLGLAPTCLDATLLTISVAGGALTVCCHGDGVVVFGQQDGGLEIHAISYAANYPFYPSYLIDTVRRTQWKAQTENEKRVQCWRLGPAGVRWKKHTSKRL